MHLQEAGRHTEGRLCLRHQHLKAHPIQEAAAVRAARAEEQSAASRQRPEVRQATTEVRRQAAITAARHQPRHVRQATVQAVAADTAEEVPAVAEATAEAAAEDLAEEEDRITIKTDIS